MRAHLLILVMSLCGSLANAATTIKGDDQALTGQTFSFSVKEYALSTDPKLVGSNFYVAAAPGQPAPDIVKNFAISVLNRSSDAFVPLAAQSAKVNGAKDVGNPLYDQGIAFMSLYNGEDSALQGSAERLAVVTDADRTTIYFLNNFLPDGRNIEVISALNVNTLVNNIPDANAAVTSGILGLVSPDKYIFATVKPNSGTFGDVGSGVAVCQVGTFGNLTALYVVDGLTFSPIQPGGNRAVALDKTSTFLRIGSDIVSMQQVVDMHWFPQVGRLYVALQLTGAGGGADGARAIAVGRIAEVTTVETDDKNNKQTIVKPVGLVFDPIAPIAAFSGVDKLVGAVGASAQISIHKIRSMFTTSALPYLICVGGVGSPSFTKKSVFAVPIVRGNSAEDLNGTIANKNSAPENIYRPTQPYIFLRRATPNPATVPSDMPLSTDAATQVGNGALLNGDITNMYVVNDTVFVTVQNPTSPQQPGIFYSQALFESNGTIKSWTTWHRAAGTVDGVFGGTLDVFTDQAIFMAANDANDVKIVKRTIWNEGSDTGLKPFYHACATIFPLANGGIQGLQDFVITDSSLQTETPGLKNISLLVATGLNGVVFAQTGVVSSGASIPVKGSDLGTLTEFTNGEITQTFPIAGSKMVSIIGGVLDDLGPIDTAQVARDGFSGSNGYLFVGGIGGVAVLSKANGSGWDATTGLSDGLSGLTAGMAFKKFGTYSFVRKIVNDDQYLYILTNKQLDRIDLTQGTPGLGSFTAQTIATADNLVTAPGSFLDVIVSGRLAMLATSKGLLRIADGYNVQTLGNDSFAWQIVETPEGAGPVRQLVAATKTGRMQDVARSVNGGLVYALSAYSGLDQGKVFRYAIAQTAASNVNGNSVQKVDDLFVKDKPAYFANYGNFKNIFATDGAAYFGAVSKQLDNDALLTILFSRSGLHSGSRFLSNRVVPVTISQASILSGLILNSATGSWLLGSNDGLRINE